MAFVKPYQKRLHDHARALAEAGFCVFPLTVTWDTERSKKRLTIPFPHAEGWNVESTRDLATIDEWFSTPRRGMKGLAIDAGKSGIVAVDLDTSDGKDGLAEWSRLPEQQSTPMTVATQSGGVHRLYRDPSGRVGVSAGQVAPGIDVRGVGGFIITAPTQVFGADGVRGEYALPEGITPVAELPELTPGMVEIITTRQESAKPRYDPAIHGNYKVSVRQGEEIIAHRLERLKSGKAMRAAIFGYAVGVAQLEGAKAARDGAELDEDALSESIGATVLEVVPWDTLDEDDREWIADGVTKGLAQPWEIVSDDEVLPEVEPSVPLADLLQREPRRMPGHPKVSHALVAPVIVEELEGRYLYVGGLGWHEWVGDRWSPDPQVPVRHAVRQMIQRHRAEAFQMLGALKRNEELAAALEELATLKESDNGGLRLAELQQVAESVEKWAKSWDDYSSWWFALANGHDYNQVMKWVEADPGRVYIPASQLDSDPHLLNCPNGTVDLRTGDIRRHDPADFITKSTRVPFDPGASHPLWDKARQSFAPGIEKWLQLKVGEGAYGFPTNDDTMMFNFGEGSNGKSTVSDAILNSLGDYAVFLHDKALLGNQHDHGTERMVLRGARWGILEELPEAQVLRPVTLKKLIGTSKITARLMRQDNVTFQATHTLLVNANHRPTVLESDRGTWRRLLAVPWPYTYKYEGEPLEDDWDIRADPQVKASLSRSIEVQKAALAWIVEGARLFHDAGQTCGETPQPVRTETDDWRRESDVFGSFFDEELIADTGHAVPSTELLTAFNEYLAALGKKPVADGYIGTRLKPMKRVYRDRVQRTAKALTISTRGPITSLPGKFTAWVGLRWQTEQEKTGG